MKITLEDRYTEWLYEHYSIGNGHRLIQLLEDAEAFSTFLSDEGLPADTELN